MSVDGLAPDQVGDGGARWAIGTGASGAIAAAIGVAAIGAGPASAGLSPGSGIAVTGGKF